MSWPLLQIRRKTRGNKSRQNVSCESFNSLIVSCSSPFNVRTLFGVVQCALHTGCVYTHSWWSLSERIFVSPCVAHSLYVSYSYVFNLLESIISRGFKGSLTRDFWLQVFFIFPQAPKYSIGAVSNFFENSRRYSRINVYHQCQRHWR